MIRKTLQPPYNDPEVLHTSGLLQGLLPFQPFVSAKLGFCSTEDTGKEWPKYHPQVSASPPASVDPVTQQHPKQATPGSWGSYSLSYSICQVSFHPLLHIANPEQSYSHLCLLKFLSLKDFLSATLEGKQHGKWRAEQSKSEVGAVPSCLCPRSPGMQSCFTSLCLSFFTYRGNDTSLAVKEKTI